MPFETRDYITAAGICVAAITALSIAQMQRKQMRQIEAYRSNPALGLKPPDNILVKLIKRYYVEIVAVWLVYSLLSELASTRPLDRKTVFFIALEFSGLAVMYVMKMIGRIYDVILKQGNTQLLVANSMNSMYEQILKSISPKESPPDHQPPTE